MERFVTGAMPEPDRAASDASKAHFGVPQQCLATGPVRTTRKPCAMGGGMNAGGVRYGRHQSRPGRT
jgi:hypothetical protein